MVEAGGNPASRKVVADRVLPSGEGDEAVGGDEPVDLDRAAGLGRAGGDRRWSGRVAAIGEELPQVVGGEPGRDGLEAGAAQQQVDDGGVGLEGDGASGMGGAEPELLPADGEVARGGTTRVTSTARSTGSPRTAGMAGNAERAQAGPAVVPVVAGGVQESWR
ncbi:hypothetical protein ABZ403_15540 [Micromonospora zamorensis]